MQTCLEILESILLSTAEDSHLSSRTGMLIVQRVLLSHLSLLYSCLNPANPPEVIKSALKLLTAMVTQGASAAREVQRSFDFTLKSLSSLPNKRDSKVQYIEILYLFILLILLAFFKGCRRWRKTANRSLHVSTCILPYTVEPRFNELLFNKVLNIMNDILHPGQS